MLLKIGDDAVAALTNQPQQTLTEVLLWQEVDRLIFMRLDLPPYATWRRRRLKLQKQFRSPEHWGIDPNAALVKAIQHSSDRNVLVAGAAQNGPTLYLAAQGCAVTTVERHQDAVERVIRAAEEAGLTQRVRGCCAELGAWSPDVELHAVVCTPDAFMGLSAQDRARVIEVLQSATVDGGVHLVQSIAAGSDEIAMEELTSSYTGWTISIERAVNRENTFVARKDAVA